MTKGIPEQIEFRANGDANSYAMINPETNHWWMALLCNGEQAIPYQVECLRRLAACWNACAGHPTEDLESHAIDRIMHARLKGAFDRIDTLLGERNKTGRAIDAAIRDGVVPEQHPLRSRLEMLANHRQREQELRAEVERVNNQINEMPGMDAFDEIDRLRAECGNWEMALGTVLATIPVKEVIRATGTVGDAVTYFKLLHQQRDELLAALTAITDHFANVMGGPMISGQGVTFANGVDGIPTIKRARELIAKAKAE